jgi:UDP-GlcNAc:undecaprenyl-phosphate GlcNAc-1-phosphate transferase
VAGFCVLAAAGALASLWWQNDLFAVLAAATVVAVLVSSRLFGHAELVLLRNSLVKLLGSVVPGGRGAGRQTAVRLQGSAAWEEVWSELIVCARRLNLLTVRFDVNAPALHEGYHASWACARAEVEAANRWRADIPLAVAGQTVARLEISGRRDEQPVSARIADIARLAEQFEAAVCRMTAALAGAQEEGVGPHEAHPVLGPPHVLMGGTVARQCPNGVGKPSPNGVGRPSPNGGPRPNGVPHPNGEITLPAAPAPVPSASAGMADAVAGAGA